MTVHQNIEFPLKARTFSVDGGAHRKLSPEERRERVEDALATLGLSELSKRKPAALSGGQRQRVALARAIVRRPEVFLMDEPLSNLDAKLRAQTRIDLVELQRKVATTFIYVTHDQVEAMTMADRIAIMTEGRLQQVGAPQAVYERPANLFVARFIGNPPMNTVDAQVVVGDDGAPHVRLDGGDIPLPAGTQVGDGDKLVVGVRPEDLELGDGPVEAHVHAVEWLGHERHVICDLGTERVIVRQETSEGRAPDPGETVRLGTDPDKLHLFDAITTERLN
jgi:multiple sugar transport system ATP-binding protein